MIRKPLDCFNIQPAVYAKAGSQFEAFAKKLLVQFLAGRTELEYLRQIGPETFKA